MKSYSAVFKKSRKLLVITLKQAVSDALYFVADATVWQIKHNQHASHSIVRPQQ